MSSNPYGAARVARQARWFMVAKAGVAVIALAWQFVLVRGLSIEEYASFTIFLAANGVLVFFTLFGLDRVLYRHVPPLREQLRWREIAWLLLAATLVRTAFIALLMAALWAGAYLLLPRQLQQEVVTLRWEYLLFSFATGCTDSFSIFINSLGKQGRQAMLLMVSTLLRFVLVAVAMWAGTVGLHTALDVMLVTEWLLAAALLFVVIREIAAVRVGAPGLRRLEWGFAPSALVRDSLSTQLTYMVGLPFRGALLRLIVGSIAPPVITASFGFFQALSDRAYQFMPVFLMKGMLEPALASDYAQRGELERVRLVMRLLLRINYLILAFGLMLLLGSGAELIGWMTHGRYSDQVPIAVLILLQLGAMTLGETLWIGLNPIGRIRDHNRVWLYVSLLCYSGVAAATAMHSAEGLLLVSVLPYVMVFAWLRWGTREPLLQGGLRMDMMWRLLPPMAAGIAGARACLWLGGTAVWVPMVAALLGGTLFLLVLRTLHFIEPDEIGTIRSISPKLAKLLSLI